MRTLQATVVAIWTFVIVIALGELFLARSEAEHVPTGEDTVMVEMQICPFEDGHPNGKPCLWFDPNTGDAYLSLSENYLSGIEPDTGEFIGGFN